MGRDQNQGHRGGDEEIRVTAREMRDQGPGRDAERVSASEPAPAAWGAVRPAASTVRRPEPTETIALTDDRVRWGPIWAGLLTALTALLLLSLLGVAIGLSTVDAGTAAARGTLPPDAGRNSAIWGAIAGLIAFFLGGWVAGKVAGVFDRQWGALNGALVFLLAVPVTLLLAGFGLGGILGTLGSFASALNVDLGAVQQAAQGATNQAQQAGQQLLPGDVERAAAGMRNGAWGALLGALLGLAASALGGALGTRQAVPAMRTPATTR